MLMTFSSKTMSKRSPRRGISPMPRSTSTLITMRRTCSIGTRWRSAPMMIQAESSAPMASPIPGMNPRPASRPMLRLVPGIGKASSINSANLRRATRSGGSFSSGSITSGMMTFSRAMRAIMQSTTHPAGSGRRAAGGMAQTWDGWPARRPLPAARRAGGGGRYSCSMAELISSDGKRVRLKDRLLVWRTYIWSWLTDPAVLLYRREAHGRRRARVLTVEFFLFVRELSREFYIIEGTSRAASLAYTTLLSLIPLLVAFTQVLQQYFKTLFPNFQSQIDNILNVVIPYQSPVLTYHLARFAENAQAASTFGVIVFIVIAFRLFLAVEATINQIWKVRSNRGYRQKIMAFTMLFFWGPVLMGLSFTSTNMLERNRLLRFFFQHDITFRIVAIIVLFIAFTMLFWLVPSARVRFSAAAVGGLFTAMLFSLVRFLFGFYAERLVHGRFNLIYGTLGLAIIFLIAIEVMWVVILLGVEISYVYQNLYGVLRASERQVEDQPRFDLYFALRALIEIARRFERREDAPSSYRLAEQLGTTDSQMLRVLAKLEDAKLVKEIRGDWTGFVPGCDPDRISIEEVVLTMEGGYRVMPEIAPGDREAAAISELFERLKQSTRTALDRLSVGQIVRELYAPRAARTEDRASR